MKRAGLSTVRFDVDVGLTILRDLSYEQAQAIRRAVNGGALAPFSGRAKVSAVLPAR